MDLIFSDMPLPDKVTGTIFLAGPSPRTADQKDWRHEAVNELMALGYTGTVFIPRWANDFYNEKTDKVFEYDDQIEWEYKARKMSDQVVFWVARDLTANFPGFITNFELGEDFNTNRIVYGRPDWAERCRYMDVRAALKKIHIRTTLKESLAAAVDYIKEGALRSNAETRIPLLVWRTKTFQSWYHNIRAHSNMLLDASVEYVRLLSDKSVFSFVLQAEVWIADESRSKKDELVFARPDISTVVPHYTDADGCTYLVMIEEFRTATRNNIGKNLEFPGGSHQDITKPDLDIAVEELHEECGLNIHPSRLTYKGSRQIAASYSSHHMHIYEIRLTEHEFLKLLKSANDEEIFGNTGIGECTRLRIIELASITKMDVDAGVLAAVMDVFHR